MIRHLFVIALCSGALAVAAAPTAPDTARYDATLKRYVVQNGAVRYADWKRDVSELSRFVEQIAAVSPDSHPALFPSRAAKMAYWLNTYNALVLSAMIRDYPEKKNRLQGPIGRTFFFTIKFQVGGVGRSLDDIEANSIRKQFNDPRIHFAIVCASKGCPWLARDAFTPDNLEELLERRTKLFVSQERNVQMDSARREIRLSEIFQSYQKDFGDVLSFVSKYLGGRPALSEGRWKVSYFPYDWSLNEALQ